MNCPEGWFPQFSASKLNDVYTHGQQWIPAGALTNVVAATIETYQSTGTGTNPPLWTVAKMPASVKSELVWSWGWKSDFFANPSAALSLKITPIWFAKTTAAGPANVVRFQHGAINMNLGTSINANENAESTMDKTVPGTAFDITGGITANEQAGLVTTWEGDVVSAGNWNFVTLNIEREGADIVDTFLSDIFLLGVGMQWVTNFNNIAVWPVS